MSEEIVKKIWQNKFGMLKSNEEFLEKILDAYSDLPRVYHNLKHLSEGLEDINILKIGSHQVFAFHLAWFGHDKVYNTNASDFDNVSDSALFTKNMALSLGLGKQNAGLASDLVLATSHTKSPRNNLEGAIIGLDLTIFGKPEKRFEEYDSAIRKEYFQYPDNIFYPERLKVLERFLKKEFIYHNNALKDKYDFQARKNLKRKVEELKEKVKIYS